MTTPTSADAMRTACESGDLPRVQELWPTFCQEVSNSDFDVVTRRLLLRASHQGHVYVVLLLLEHDAKLDNDLPMTVAKTGADHSAICQVFSRFLDKGWDPNTDHPNHGTVLVQAITRDNRPLVNLLLSRGADPNLEFRKAKADWLSRHRLAGTQAGMTPLDVAARASSPDMIQTLLDRGAELDRANPLHAAAAAMVWGDEGKSRIPMIEFLLDKGLKINAIEKYPETSSVITWNWLATPLHYAARWQHTERVKLLIERGADPRIEAQGGTPLDWLRDMSDPENDEIDPELEALLIREMGLKS